MKRKPKRELQRCDACREPARIRYLALVCKGCAEKFAALRGKPLAAPIKTRGRRKK